MQRSEGAVINPFCVNPTMQSRIENYPQQPVVVVVVVVVVCVSGGGGRRTHSTVLEPHSHSLLLSTEARPDGFICCFGPLFCRLESSATLSVRPEKKRLNKTSLNPTGQYPYQNFVRLSTPTPHRHDCYSKKQIIVTKVVYESFFSIFYIASKKIVPHKHAREFCEGRVLRKVRVEYMSAAC